MDSAWTGAPVARICVLSKFAARDWSRVHGPGPRRRVALSVFVLTPLPAAPAPASPHRLIGYEEIPHIPSRSDCSLEPCILVKRIACHHPRFPRAYLLLPALVVPLQPLCVCSDIVQPCHNLQTLVQVVLWPALDMRLLLPTCLRPSPPRLCHRRARPPHPFSGTLGHFWPTRSRHVAPQSGNASAPLPNQPQFGTVSTAARHCQAAARPPLLLAFLPCSPS
jgi:hypothetical protein